MRSRHRKRSGTAVLGVVVSGVLACGESGETQGTPSVVRTDSAGVEVVSLAVHVGSAPEFAELQPLPRARLGSPLGLPEEQFGKIGDVVGLWDGGLAVLDEQAGEVRLFDSTGSFRRTFGSKGQGPGEFQSPVALVVLRRDTIGVFDPTPRRVTRFSVLDGALQVTTLDDVEALISDARFLSDGSLVSQSHWMSPEAAPPSAEPTLVRDTVVLSLFDASGQVVDTVDVVPSREEIVSVQMRPGMVSVRKRAPAFARTNLFAPADEGLWSSTNDRFELRLRQWSSGRLLRIVRAPGLERSVTSELADSILSHVSSEAESAQERSWIRTWFDLSPRPRIQPGFDMLEVDAGDRVWVREWSPFGSARRWWVFEPDGSLAGRVDTPVVLRITSIHCDSVVGVEQDQLGVEYAVRYSFQEPIPC